MKIQCEQCKIEYTIDDASIGERGIRAQCPKCNHITTIRKSQAAILDQARAKLDTAICVNCGKPCEPNPGDPIPICKDCQALGGDITGAKTTVSGQQVPPASPSNPLAGLPGFNSPVNVPGFGQAPPPMPSFGGTPTPGGAGPAPVAARGFPDAASSIPAPPVYAPPQAAGDGRSWRIKKAPSGEIYGPFDRELIAGWIDTDKIVPADEICRVGGPWKTASEHEDFVDLFRARYKLPGKPAQPAPSNTAPSAPPAPETTGGDPEEHEPTQMADAMPPGAGGAVNPRAGDVRTARGGAMAIAARQLGSRPASRGVPKGLLLGVAAIVVGAVVIVGIVHSGAIGKIKTGLSATPTPAIEDETDQQIASFAHDFAGATGTAADHVKAGRDAMATDTVVGWQTARKEFGQALALDKKNPDALAGVSEVDALLGLYDDDTTWLKESMELSVRAVDRSPGSADANRAKATALLASKSPANYGDARNLLSTQVLTKSSNDALATAMLGAAWRGTDDAKAEELLAKSVAMGPDLIRPKLELGLLYEAQNRYQKALETFKPISAKSYLAAFHSGQILEHVGKYREAAAAYDAAAKVGLADGGGRSWAEAVLAQAVIDYQALDKTKDALALLGGLDKKITAGELKLKPELEGRIRLHLAIADRLLGTNEALERSLALTQQVRALQVPELSAAAHFNAALVRLRKADFDGADKEFEDADAPTLSSHHVRSEIYFWQGQLKQRRGDSAAAGSKYEDSFHEDSENWRAVVAEAAMMADASDQEVAGLDKMQLLANVDPDFYDNYQRVTLFYPDPSGEILSKAARSFEKIYPNHSVDSRASTAIGLVAYYQKNMGKASQRLNAAMQETSPDIAAQIYSALLLESRGGEANLKAAIDRLQLVKTNSPSAFVSLVIGRCFLRLGKLDDATAAFTESLQQNPNYAPGQYWFGELLSKRGDKKGAIVKWSEALRDEPNYLRPSQAIALQDG